MHALNVSGYKWSLHEALSDVVVTGEKWCVFDIPASQFTANKEVLTLTERSNMAEMFRLFIDVQS